MHRAVRVPQQLCRHSTAHKDSYLQRCISVVAWGRNTSGEVGQGLGVVYEEPAILSDLEGADVIDIGAGRHHSAAVVRSERDGGTVWSWGNNNAGKLGHGTLDQSPPSRIEALVGVADIHRVALGHQHTLLLDAEGAVYSCGDNQQGQCGLGTPLQALADQQRAEWEVGRAEFVSMSQDSAGSNARASFEGSQSGPWSASQQQQQQRLAWSQFMQPFALQKERQAELEVANRLMAAEGNSLNRTSVAPGLNGASSLHPFGHNLTPTRIGMDLDSLVSDQPSTSGLDSEVVSDLTASRFYSALACKSGRVLTFGGGFSGELGNDRSWETKASSVDGPVLEALQDGGGAQLLSAGGTFCMALTKAGGVVLWGSLPGQPETRRRGARSRVLRIEDLPRIQHIAAGHSHALMSDGRSVWTMGRWLTPSGGVQHGGKWGQPEEIIRLDGVRSLAAGSHLSAVVSDEGQLHIWGKLLSEDDVRMLRQKHSHRVFTEEKTAGSAWEGLGSDRPMLVSGLGRVRAVSFGFQHAIAVVE